MMLAEARRVYDPSDWADWDQNSKVQNSWKCCYETCDRPALAVQLWYRLSVIKSHIATNTSNIKRRYNLAIQFLTVHQTWHRGRKIQTLDQSSAWWLKALIRVLQWMIYSWLSMGPLLPSNQSVSIVVPALPNLTWPAYCTLHHVSVLFPPYLVHAYTPLSGGILHTTVSVLTSLKHVIINVHCLTWPDLKH